MRPALARLLAAVLIVTIMIPCPLCRHQAWATDAPMPVAAVFQIDDDHSDQGARYDGWGQVACGHSHYVVRSDDALPAQAIRLDGKRLSPTAQTVPSSCFLAPPFKPPRS